MIRMVLADDEPIITRGIQKLVDFNSLGIQVVGEYQDGRAALDGILAAQPDIALLDIHMPKKSGIDIIKELKAVGNRTKIIFISGFQDFQYAKDALRYGAEDYLLKPIIREELLAALEGCCAALKENWLAEKAGQKAEGGEQEELPYDILVDVEETVYVPAVADILWNGEESRQERKLIRFSVSSYVEKYLAEKNRGIIFTKNKNLVIILKGMDRQEGREFLRDMAVSIEKSYGHRIGILVGPEVNSISQIPEGYQRCLEWRGYLFFADQLGVPVLFAQSKVFRKEVGSQEFDACREQLLDAMVSQNREAFHKCLKQFVRYVCIRSEGKKEDACYHFCTTIRMAGDRVSQLGVPPLDYEVKDILEQGRETANYRQMSDLYGSYLERYLEQVKNSIIRSDRKDIIKAKEYIEEHYRENLTLEVLASTIHMNPYYFSSFFKKNSGENFKDYVNKVRLKHAMALLVTTDKKTYEIADQVGFRDARSFSELFQRTYGETPANYRKRVKREKKEGGRE